MVDAPCGEKAGCILGLCNQGGLLVAGYPRAAKPFNVRLPMWAIEYLEERSAETGETKTQLVIDAISCLRAEHVRALMREGYEEMREIDRRMAEDDLAAGAKCLPEW